MKKLKLILAAILVLSIAVTSCKKKSAPAPKPTSAPTPPTPQFTGSVSGVFAAVKLDFMTTAPAIPGVGSLPDIGVESQIATAIATSSPGNFTTLVDLGTVNVNSIALEKQTNNSYFKLATIGMNPEDLGFGSTINWTASGISLNVNTGGSFPKYTPTLPSTITRSSGLTISHTTAETGSRYGGIILIVSGDKTILREFNSTSGSTTISAADLGVLPASEYGFIEVCPYSVTSTTVSGKTYYFVKEYAAAKMVKVN